MNPDDKSVLSANINLLIKAKNLNALIHELLNRNVLTPYLLDQLNMIPLKEDRARALFDELKSRGPAAFEHLLSALAFTDNFDICRIINQKKNQSESQYLKIKVIKSKKPIEVNDDSKIYRMYSQPKGYALIININRFFEPGRKADLANKTRSGSYRDVANLYTLFYQLGYVVIIHYDLSKQEIRDKIDDFANMPEHATVDSTIVIVMSHGGIIENTFKSYDNLEVHCDRDIVAPFKSKHLQGKPKIFIFQICRGDDRDHGIERDNLTSPSTVDSTSSSAVDVIARRKEGKCFVTGNASSLATDSVTRSSTGLSTGYNAGNASSLATDSVTSSSTGCNAGNASSLATDSVTSSSIGLLTGYNAGNASSLATDSVTGLSTGYNAGNASSSATDSVTSLSTGYNAGNSSSLATDSVTSSSTGLSTGYNAGNASSLSTAAVTSSSTGYNAGNVSSSSTGYDNDDVTSSSSTGYDTADAASFSTSGVTSTGVQPVADREPLINNRFQIYSTSFDHKSIRHEVLGGYFVQCMCMVFAENAHRLELRDLIEETSRRLKAIYDRYQGFMTPTMTYSADCGKFFFNPGIYAGRVGVQNIHANDDRNAAGFKNNWTKQCEEVYQQTTFDQNIVGYDRNAAGNNSCNSVSNGVIDSAISDSEFDIENTIVSNNNNKDNQRCTGAPDHGDTA
ncbi:hypothetical protein LSTR_LSTR011026 [Laodelphax striatellus]|uniref:Caspase n=1 Tax=Laodelphax striatellus TaxID=195883 RepID=A0A482XDX6_LAOST|nr:hypothetical protein LSTR_LSTR011026 [Laodelphax striatellus]